MTPRTKTTTTRKRTTTEIRWKKNKKIVARSLITLTPNHLFHWQMTKHLEVYLEVLIWDLFTFAMQWFIHSRWFGAFFTVLLQFVSIIFIYLVWIQRFYIMFSLSLIFTLPLQIVDDFILLFRSILHLSMSLKITSALQFWRLSTKTTNNNNQQKIATSQHSRK